MEAVWKAFAENYFSWIVAGIGLIVAFFVYIKQRSLGVALVIVFGSIIFSIVSLDPMFYFGKIGDILRSLFSLIKPV